MQMKERKAAFDIAKVLYITLQVLLFSARSYANII